MSKDSPCVHIVLPRDIWATNGARSNSYKLPSKIAIIPDSPKKHNTHKHHKSDKPSSTPTTPTPGSPLHTPTHSTYEYSQFYNKSPSSLASSPTSSLESDPLDILGAILSRHRPSFPTFHMPILEQCPIKMPSNISTPYESRFNTPRSTSSFVQNAEPALPPLPLQIALRAAELDKNDKVNRSKQAAQIANRLMNFKLANDTVPEALSPSKPPNVEANGLAAPTPKKTLNPSPETLLRVQRAKANLELHYDLMAAYREFAAACGSLDSSKKPPIPTRYNPLQIIRNRKIRLAQVPGEPESSNKRHHHSKQTKNAATGHWEIDRLETILDYSWQCQSYHLMKGPDGKLLYPEQSKQTLKEEEMNEKLMRALSHHNLNDISSKAFAARLKLLQDNNNTTKSKSSQRNSPSAKSQSDSASLDISPRSSKSQILGSQASVTAESAHSSQTHTPIERVGTNSSRAKSPSSNDDSKPSSTVCTPGSISRDPLSRSSSAQIQAAPIVVSPPFIKAPRPCEPVIISQIASDIKYQELTLFLRHSAFASCAHNSCYYRDAYPHALMREREAKQLCGDFNSKVSHANKEVIPSIKASVQAKEVQISTLRQTKLSTTSTRIDRLMADSDRTCNRLSTSLNLEIKQLSERLEVLERHSSAIRFKWIIVNAGFQFLEYFVLFLMWLIWGFVSIILGVRSVFTLTGCTLKWLLWL